MIRLAEPKDFLVIVEHSREFWGHTQFKDEPFCEEQCLGFIEAAHNQGLLAVSDSGGVIAGFIAGISGPLMCNPNVLVGTELAWWVTPKYRSNHHALRLLTFIEERAIELGIKYWNMVSMQSSMPDQVNAMYEKMGYELAETTYTKRLI